MKRFEFVRCESVPRLGWCAHLQRDNAVVRVYHGPWVETRDEWFVEGAWTGPFERGEMDSALFNLGSGGVLRQGRAVFCTQTDMIERLYSLRAGDDLFISNSLVFVFAMADDEPDPCYPFFTRLLQEYQRDGIWRKDKTLRTRRGRRLRLHEHCLVAVKGDLTLVRIEKAAFPPPTRYDEYISMLLGVLRALIENAGSPARRHRRYEVLATVSGGYDANALAVLLGQLGVREAITFYDELSNTDSGEEVARRLGMTVRVYGRNDFHTTPGVDEAEFLAWPSRGHDIVLAPCEPQLVGKVLVTGRYGDTALSSDDAKVLSDFRRGRSVVSVNAGAGMLEFRLRVGFLNCSPFYAGAVHLTAMRKITASSEMKPWRLGGDYDRPIARRIVEEAGIPRGIFGVAKAASAYYLFNSLADMSPSDRADFEAYRRTMPRPGVLRRAWYRGLVNLRLTCEMVVKKVKTYWWTGGTVAESLIPIPWRYRDYDDIDFAFHWGRARVGERYAEARKALGDAKAPRN